jgi:SAM-dependent methyltransferase
METISPPPLQDLLRYTLEFTHECLNQGDLPAAHQALDRAINLAPGNAQLLSQRGLLSLHLKDHESARLDFIEASRVDPRCAIAHAGLARCHWQKGAFAEAAGSAKRSLEIDPANGDALDVLSALQASRNNGKLSGKGAPITHSSLAHKANALSRSPVQAPTTPASRQARRNVWNFLRTGCGFFADAKPPLLSRIHLQNSRLVPRRKDILALMPKGGVCAEIGTQTGNFAKQILLSMQPAKLHIYDIDFMAFDHPYFQQAIRQGVVELHQGDSASSLAKMPDRHFDFIYVDGDHAYEGAVRDLEQAERTIKADGWIVCNDYTIYSPLEKAKYGVYRAVNEFCWKHGFEIIYLGLHQWSYHDVALRRMKPEDLAVALAGRPVFRTRQNPSASRNGVVTENPTQSTASATVPKPANVSVETVDAASVIQTIGAGDEMFTGDQTHYFGVGKSALHGIETALLATGKPRNSIRNILDLPCGHGRVMRFFKAAFPQAQITACDLNKGAVDFCAQTFAAQPVYSNVDVNRIPLHGKYDLIWSGSLLTHLRPEACAEFIRLFNTLVNPGGVIAFTLHGRWVERSLATNRYTYGLKSADVTALLKEYYETGFGYADYPGAAGYGISVSSPAYVLSQLIALPDLKLISYHEKGWDNHQDIVCLQKLALNEPMG